jgi:hypothetical protein
LLADFALDRDADLPSALLPALARLADLPPDLRADLPAGPPESLPAACCSLVSPWSRRCLLTMRAATSSSRPA